jgi:hypothetical protein
LSLNFDKIFIFNHTSSGLLFILFCIILFIHLLCILFIFIIVQATATSFRYLLNCRGLIWVRKYILRNFFFFQMFFFLNSFLLDSNFFLH